MARYAVIRDGVVVNVVIWDGESPCEPLADAVELPADSPVGVGYTVIGGEYVAPVFSDSLMAAE